MTTQADRGGGLDVLLVEDNPGDVRLTEEAFEDGPVSTELNIVTRGEEALDYLFRRDDYEDVDRPDIVLLDLNLPGTNGLSVLEEIKTTPELKVIPVIILTSSEDRDDVLSGYEGYANAYLTKPVDVEAFVDAVRSFGVFWAETAKLPPLDA